MSTAAQNEKALVANREFVASLDKYLEELFYDDDEIEGIVIAILAKVDKLNGTLRGIGV